MKEPKSKLPWRDFYDGIQSNDFKMILHGEDNSDGTYYNVEFKNKQDHDYCLQACNNFPKIIELLKEVQNTLGIASEDYNSGLLLDKADKIEQFLKSLEE